MEKALILETTFLIDLEREAGRKKAGPAQKFLQQFPDSHLYITFTIAGELAAGVSLADRPRWEEFLLPFHILVSTKDVCWQYGSLFRFLKENGMLIGGNDLWIAATALTFEIPIVTRNVRHYRRVPGLEVVTYTR